MLKKEFKWNFIKPGIAKFFHDRLNYTTPLVFFQLLSGLQKSYDQGFMTEDEFWQLSSYALAFS
jgi:hypothetical protein